jgi:hypothetical protein
LVGEGSNYCEGCQEALRPQKYQVESAKLTDRQQAAIEMQDQVDFERAHRWGADQQSTRWFAEYEEEDWPEGAWD